MSQNTDFNLNHSKGLEAEPLKSFALHCSIPPSENNSITAKKEAKFLIVDDDKVSCTLLEATLKAGGYTDIHLTQNPFEVGSLMDENQYDLIILDINMPGINGFTVLSIIQQQDEFLPVMMVSGDEDSEAVIESLRLGARDFIRKPFKKAELLHRVETNLEHWFLHRFLKLEQDFITIETQRQTQELQKAKFEIIERLGRASEYRDNETGNHVKRVGLISKLIAKEVGCDDEYCKLIMLAAPLHDVGKIGIPDTILLKPGKLTLSEYKTMQQHVQIGGEILSDSSSSVMRMAHEIALTHHEKFNGQGYPNGLSGNDIPLSGRIVAIADVFDALTTERPYKLAWSIERAIEFISSEKGNHFDPELVDAFIKISTTLIGKLRDLQDEPVTYGTENTQKSVSA